MKKMLFFTVCCMATLALFAQTGLPTDYLSPAFHKSRREALRSMMPQHSVMAIFAYPVRKYSNDVNYVYHPSPDLYYFTGYNEPHAMLLIFKDQQRYKDSISYNELFFVRKRDAQREQWTGRRLGAEGVKKSLGIQMVFTGDAFKNFPLDFSVFEKIIFDELPDATGEEKGAGSLVEMADQFRLKTKLPDDFDSKAPADLKLADSYDNGKNTINLINYLKRNIAAGKYKNTKLVNAYIEAKDSLTRKQLVADLGKEKWDNNLYTDFTEGLRGIKTPEEMELLRKAVEISAIAHTEVMKAIRPDMSEREIEGMHDYVQKKFGAEHWGYPAIVGAGNNGCVLHYEENSKQTIGKNTLLMDVGAEYHGYSADITRTVPANGKFSAEEKIVYNIVYDAQEAAFKLCKEGSTFEQIESKAREIVAKGLVRIGLIKTEAESRKYYPHGCSHHIGLDVHDKGSYDTLKKNMVITVEPGIYIPEGSDCDKKWWGIAVRIEDDLLIREKDYELLSSYAPRKAEDVERMVAEKSGFDEVKLPPLKSAKKGF